jgi:hypothetical protein
MQLHEEFCPVPKDPEADVCGGGAPIRDLTKDVLMQSHSKF